MIISYKTRYIDKSITGILNFALVKANKFKEKRQNNSMTKDYSNILLVLVFTVI